MGLRDLTKRLRTSVDELDDRRLQDRFVGLGLTCIGQMEARAPVRVGGEITRMRVTPLSGVSTFEITVDDGTGTVVAVFTTGAIVQVFLLANSIPKDTWNAGGTDGP